MGSIEIDSGSMESTINWQESAKADVQRKIEKLKNAWETVKNLNAPSEITIVKVDYAMRMANSEVEAAGNS